MERRAAELTEEVERLMQRRDELRAEIVPYQPVGVELVRRKDLEAVRLQVQRGRPRK